MTENLPSIQRRITRATGTPTCLNRPGVAPADSAEGRAGVESVVEPAVAEAPILITEQEVLFNTAAATLVRPATNPRHWPGTALFAAGRRIHIRLPEPRPIYPRLERSYFETARMSRLMDRL